MSIENLQLVTAARIPRNNARFPGGPVGARTRDRRIKSSHSRNLDSRVTSRTWRGNWCSMLRRTPPQNPAARSTSQRAARPVCASRSVELTSHHRAGTYRYAEECLSTYWQFARLSVGTFRFVRVRDADREVDRDLPRSDAGRLTPRTPLDRTEPSDRGRWSLRKRPRATVARPRHG
jgi:hypothetical protein